MKHWTLTVFVIASLAIASLAAKETSIAGTWTLSIERIGVKLVLEQQKGAVTGTLDWPHGDPIKLTGAFTDERLTFVAILPARISPSISTRPARVRRTARWRGR